MLSSKLATAELNEEMEKKSGKAIVAFWLFTQRNIISDLICDPMLLSFCRVCISCFWCNLGQSQRHIQMFLGHFCCLLLNEDISRDCCVTGTLLEITNLKDNFGKAMFLSGHDFSFFSQIQVKYFMPFFCFHYFLCVVIYKAMQVLFFCGQQCF